MSDGYGICGHKNSYSSGVKNAWVEDFIGMELANNQSRTTKNQMTYTTETREKIIHPNLMKDNAGGKDITMLTAQQIKSKNKNGLPADMLFSHLGAPGSDRFMSVNAMTFTNGVGSGGIRAEDLLQEKLGPEAKAALDITPVSVKMREKAKQDARKESLISSYTTNSNASSSRAYTGDFKIRTKEEVAPKMPDFRRRKIQIA